MPDEDLTEEQIKLSRPPVDTSCEEIDNEIENLQYSALPNYMTIVPIRTKKREAETPLAPCKGFLLTIL